MGRTSMLEIRTLGGLSIRLAVEPVTGMASRKVEALLVYLACSGRAHPREVLAEMFWEERAQAQAMANLRVALSSLRKHLKPYVTITRDAVALNPDAKVWLDVAEFEGKLSAGEVEDAVDLYRGDFLEGFFLRGSRDFDDWMTIERERLRQLVLNALGDLMAAHLAAGTYQDGIPVARRLLHIDPCIEAAHCQLMRLLAYSGQRGAALAQFETCRQALKDELGVEPTEETKTLYEQIQAGELEPLTATPDRLPLISPVRIIHGYELQERIGAGGFGEVYRAYQPSVGRTVAIKIILPQYANRPEFIRRFEREAQLVARLEHPHIVPLYDYWHDTEGTFLVMRFLRGGNLRQALQRGPWRPKAAVQLLEQVAGALTVAHRQGVVHRDVKPENILLDEQSNAYLSDFGIAKDLLRVTTTSASGTLAGSLAYISPEQAQGQPITPQSDLYSLGVVAYELLTGEHPFFDETPASQLVKHMTEALPPLWQRQPDLPAALDPVILRATAKDPTERFPDTLSFARAFREAIAEPTLPDGDVPEVEIRSHVPPFLAVKTAGPLVERPVFVARERELERLDNFLQSALSGHGQVAFVTGGGGRGKTALLNEFARRAMDAHSDLLVASGNCNAFSGVGDPYLPFRDVLGMLAGNVESRWAAGSITRDHARRLWEALPLAVQALLNHGPHLLDVFLPGPALISRAARAAADGAPWLHPLKETVRRHQARSDGLEQSHLFQQVTNLVHALAEAHPLLLVLDDMQWADTGSIGLLFHLGRRLEGARILIACAYRSEEIALGRDGERHPLEKVLAELKRHFGDVWVDLAQVEEAEGRRFVDCFLEAEPNRLGDTFRRGLYRHTQGHPLFTIELLRAMQERGDLVQDKTGHWVEGAPLDWETLPARVEAVIQERIGRLDEELRDILTVASVEGEDFTVQVVAQVQEMSERRLMRSLSQELEKRHRLVREQGGLWVGQRRLARYRFAHALFQQYLYNDLGEGERVILHQEIGELLEELYDEQIEVIAVQLAHHAYQAGDERRALRYFTMAADVALAAYANQEAESHYRRAIALPCSEVERADLSSGLGETLFRQGRTAEALQAYREGIKLYQSLGNYDGVARLYARAGRAAAIVDDEQEGLRLCQEGLAAVSGTPDSPGLARLLHETGRAYLHNGLEEKAHLCCQEALEMAERSEAVDVQADTLTTIQCLPTLTPEECWAAGHKALALVEQAGLPDIAVRVHFNLAVGYAWFLGDLQRQRHHFLKAAEIARQSGHLILEARCLICAAGNSLDKGELSTAEEELSEIERLLTHAPEASAIQVLLDSLRADLLWMRGDWDASLNMTRAGLAEARRQNNRRSIGGHCASLGGRLLELDQWVDLDDLAEAEAALKEAVPIYEGGIDRFFRVGPYSRMTILRARQNHIQAARDWLGKTEEAARERPRPWNELALQEATAEVALMEERWTDAIRAIERAAEVSDQLGARWASAYILAHWADMHRRRGEGSDIERAGELLREARALFKDMGTDGYIRLVDDRLQALCANE